MIDCLPFMCCIKDNLTSKQKQEVVELEKKWKWKTGSARELKQKIKKINAERYCDLANLIRTHHTSVQHITSCLITGPGALSDGNSNLVVLEMEHA